jgi:hypothetical protein
VRAPSREFTLFCGEREVRLEQIDAAGDEWFGEIASASAVGSLREVLDAVLPGADPQWRDVVLRAVAADQEAGAGRVGLVVSRGAGTRFHASRAANRDSIAAHGLDWRRMDGPGVAGSRRPEWPGVYLADGPEDAQWFADMAGGDGDIWQVSEDGLWLVSDPNASGGLEDGWAIAAEPIAPERVTLHRAAPERGTSRD